jgi:AraC family ethanolamine operon transcriptional activator
MRQESHASAQSLPTLPTLAHTAFDESTYRQTLVNWELEVVQLSRGDIAGESKEVNLEGLHILHESFRNVTLNHYGRARANSFVFALPLALRGEARHNGHFWTSELNVFRSERDIDAVLPPMELLSLVIDRNLLNGYVQATEHIDLEQWLSRQALMIEDPAASAGLAHSLCEILSSCFDGEVDLGCEPARKAVRNAILEAIAPVVVRHLDVRPAPFREFSRSMVVRKAREHVLERITEPLQVIDLCRAAGVSRRALQQSFQDVLGVNPVAYLRMLRLSGARRDLLNASAQTQVKEVVAAWGFWHLSRFSQEYRQMFGELPSETLRLARKPAQRGMAEGAEALPCTEAAAG